MQAVKEPVYRKGPWQTIDGIDDVSEGSELDEYERLSEAQQAKCKMEA